MTDLQKDQAIYGELLKIANDVFKNAADNSDLLRSHINRNGGCVSLKEILKHRSVVYNMIAEETPNVTSGEYMSGKKKEVMKNVKVDSFSCTFAPMNVFSLLDTYKKNAKIGGEVTFAYAEKIDREFVGTIEMIVCDVSKAKKLADLTTDEHELTALQNVLVQLDDATGDINLVASSGDEIAVISNNPGNIMKPYDSKGTRYDGLFTPAAWRRICDYAKANDSRVTFEVYSRNKENEYELQDIMVAVLGDVRISSIMMDMARYPNWKKVLPSKDDMLHVTIEEKDASAARKWVSKLKPKDQLNPYESVAISTYKGSDMLYFDTYNNTTKFKLSGPSEFTAGARLCIKKLNTKKFSGFWFASNGDAYLDGSNADLMFMCHVIGELAPKKKQRER